MYENVVIAARGFAQAICPVRNIAHSMVSVDTGPAHAAAALGLPLVVMFGAAAQRFWLPRSSYGSPVIGLGGPPASWKVEGVSSQQVFEAWISLAGSEAPVKLRQSRASLR